MLKVEHEKVWAGTEASLKAALEAEESISKSMAAGGYGQDDEDDDEEEPRLLEVSDGIGVISIKGALNNESGFWNEVFGMTGYPEIRDALIKAANDPGVKSIMLDIDSGGGAVSGVADTAALIRTINDRVKPVYAFTDGTMASAAYWLGCAAGKVHAGRTAVVGSIGVLSTHREYSKALREAGVGVTVIRAGKYKALANSVEPLSEDGKKQIQQVVDAAYQVFVEHVASMRGHSYTYTDENMAQGREFVGETAMTADLVDSITTFDKVISDLKEKSIDSSNNFMDNRGKSNTSIRGNGGTDLTGDQDMKKNALTEKDIAAIAAGVQVTAAAQANAEANADLPGGNAAADEQNNADAAAAAGERDDKVEGAVDAAASTGTESAGGENVDTTASTVQFLSAQLKDKDEQLIAARVRISRLEEDAAAAAATHQPLLEIAAKSVNNMRVALNLAQIDASSMDAVQMLAEHARTSEQFASTFKVGGIAAVSADQSVKSEPVVQDALTQARLAAVRISHKSK